MADLKPKDFVRCAGCHRPVQRALAVTIDGTQYGADCAAKIKSNYRAIRRREQT